MAIKELSKSRSICILAIVVGCFAILWPKIFLPMIQTALSLKSSQTEDHIRPDKNMPTMIPPKVREAMRLSRPEEIRREPGRPFEREKVITNEQINKGGGGVTGYVMPLYTIGIVIFFLYTMFKMVFKNKPEDEPISTDEKPKVQDFQMDPEYRKFILSEEYDERGVRIERKTNSKRKSLLRKENDKYIPKTEKVIENYGKDTEENEINRLQKKLEDTEAEMEMILKQMNRMSGKLAANGILPSATFYKNDQNIINKLKRELSEDNEDNEESNESNAETSEEEENEDQENSDQDCSQNIDGSDSDNRLTSEEKIVNEEIENTDIDCMYEQNLNEKLFNNLDSNVWESVKCEMQNLQKLKEE